MKFKGLLIGLVTFFCLTLNSFGSGANIVMKLIKESGGSFDEAVDIAAKNSSEMDSLLKELGIGKKFMELTEDELTVIVRKIHNNEYDHVIGARECMSGNAGCKMKMEVPNLFAPVPKKESDLGFGKRTRASEEYIRSKVKNGNSLTAGEVKALEEFFSLVKQSETGMQIGMPRHGLKVALAKSVAKKTDGKYFTSGSAQLWKMVVNTKDIDDAGLVKLAKIIDDMEDESFESFIKSAKVSGEEADVLRSCFRVK